MRKLLLNLHLYCALIVGIFVIIVGLSGSVIAFEPELDALMNPHLFRIAPQADRLPVAGLFQAASRAFPGQKIGNLRLPQSADETVQFNIKGPRQVFMNPYTGAIVGERDPKTVLAKIHQIHQRLLIGGGRLQERRQHRCLHHGHTDFLSTVRRVFMVASEARKD